MMRFLAAVLLLFFASSAMAQAVTTGPNPPGPVMQSAPYLTMPAGIYQQFTPTAAVGLPNIPQGANYALMICTGQTVNWTDDGKTAPTTSVGMPLPISTPFIFAEHPLTLVQIIQTAATATCNVSYYQ